MRKTAQQDILLLVKYAQTATPDWIFIDESFACKHEKEIVNIINKGIPFKQPNYAFMSAYGSHKNQPNLNNIETIYKPRILEKIMQITENCCNPH